MAGPARPDGGSSPATLVTPRVAADLAGIPIIEVRALMRSGSAHVERIRGVEYVRLEDLDAARPEPDRRAP